jgi:hypothetical protein
VGLERLLRFVPEGVLRVLDHVFRARQQSLADR